MPTPTDIAKFRYKISEQLTVVRGFLYDCSDVMNALLRRAERRNENDPSTYCILMVNKIVPKDPTRAYSDQRNIYFRKDTTSNIFYMEYTGRAPENNNGVIAYEHDVYFFPDAFFVTVPYDYQALDKYIDEGTEPETKVRSVSKNLAAFVNNNDNIPFALSPTHTQPLVI